MKIARTVFSLLALALATAPPLHAQEVRKLKFAHVFPANHYLWEHGGKPFVEAVTAKTSGRLTFDVYPAAQLGKDYVSLLKSNLADAALLVPSYTPQSLPLTSVSELPGFYSRSCQATRMLWQIAKPGGALNDAEYKPQGLHVLFVSTLPPFKVMTASKPVRTLGDMKGLKIRANGAAMDKTVSNLGATPIRVTAGELFDSLTRGTVDGGFFPYHSIPTFDLASIFKYAVDGPQLGSGSVIFAISEKVWNGLGAEDQASITAAASTAQERLCAWLDEEEQKVREELVGNHGLIITNLDDAARREWQTRVGNVAQDWATELDARNRPGSAMLEAFRKAAH